MLFRSEIASIRKGFGYIQVEFAKLLGVGEKNFARYEAGISAQSRSMDWVLRMLRERQDNILIIDKGRVDTKKVIKTSPVSGTKHCTIPDMSVKTSVRTLSAWKGPQLDNWQFQDENYIEVTGTDS